MSRDLQPLGDCIGTDTNGFLQKTVSRDTVQPELLPLIQQIIETATSVFGDNLHSLYVRGSVAKSTFIPNISDLDTVVVTRTDCGDESEQSYIESVKKIELGYPEVHGIEKGIRTVKEFVDSGNPIFKYQTVCVYGDDLAERMPVMKPGKDTTVHLPKVLERLGAAQKSVPDMSKERLQSYSIWICKQAIRSCHELLAEQLQQFARDIYPCYKAAADAWPDQEPLLRQTAEVAIFGTQDKDELLEIINQIKSLLEPKIHKFYRYSDHA
ncbi:hypothetical protein KC973_03800 [Candidatus Saccharibacteria bacterium]|nr:hypothetical protein [Candidatus Saccharibacteria bacterium]